MKTAKNLEYLLILCCLILFFAHLGKLYVDIMEARNFVSAREMVENGHWIFTTMNGVPRYEKPPLPTWFSAVTGKLFGMDAIWALRLPAAFFSMILVLYFNRIVRLVTKNIELAFIASFILATSFLVVFVGRRATWDIYCYSFMVIGIYYVLLAVRGIKAHINYIAAGFFFGLSFLSKGPTGPYVFFIPFYLGYVICYGLPSWKTIKGLLLMVFVCIIIGGSWYAYIYSFDASTFVQIMEKEASARGNRDVKPFTRYLSFPVQMGVWILFCVVSLISPLVKKRRDYRKAYFLFFYWAILSLLLLSLIPSKKERYLFPMMVPLAATTAFYLYYLSATVSSLKNWELKLNQSIFYLLGAISLLLGVGIFFIKTIQVDFFVIIFSLSALGCGIYILFAAKHKRFLYGCIGIILLMNSVALFGIPIIDKLFHNNKNYKSLTGAKTMIKSSGLKLYAYYEYSPEVWFRYGEIMPEIIINEPDTYPQEKEFFMVMNPSGDNATDSLHIKSLDAMHWKVSQIDTFDDNEEGAGSKNHSNRKLHYLYSVTR